jgi:hypothetical protein
MDGSTAIAVCDVSSDATYGGSCVECTGTDYACGKAGDNTPYVCDSLRRECSTQKAGNKDLCGGCVSDAECQTGKLCVLQTFNDPNDSPDQGAIEIGYFCVWRFDANPGPDMNCFSKPPYVTRQSSTTSLDGTTADVCTLRTSTCPAQVDFSNKDCAPGGTPQDNLCGDPDAPTDGYCLETSSPGIYRCTVPCGGDPDCKPNGFFCTVDGSTKCSL